MPASLRELPQDRVPLRPFDTVGLPALRALLVPGAAPVTPRACEPGHADATRCPAWPRWPTTWPRPATA